jgi:hypothetical protein
MGIITPLEHRHPDGHRLAADAAAISSVTGKLTYGGGGFLVFGFYLAATR